MSETNNSKAYDAHLYDDFAEVGSFQSYDYLNGNPDYREDQKSKFLSGEIENPVLDYPDLDSDWLSETEVKLVQQKQNIIENEQDNFIKQVYRWRLNEKIAEIRMLRAVSTGEMSRFRRYSEFVYGEPSKEIFAYTINNIRQKALESVGSENEDLKAAAEELLEALPDLEDVSGLTTPSAHTIEQATRQTTQELGSLIDVIDDKEKLDANQIKEAFESALKTLGVTDWEVVIDSETSRTAISVNQETKTVNIPEGRQATAKKVATLILHEIGTHVARRVNGEKSRLMLLGLGLDRYERGEEGIATMREQAYAKKVDDFSGLDGYLAISLAIGVDGKPRDFRQVYEVLDKYYTFKNLQSGKTKAEAEANQSAWTRSVRTFRGTDCKTPGVAFTKDAVYREGSIAIWDLISNYPDQMKEFNQGKYDPTNPRHIWILEELMARALIEALT